MCAFNINCRHAFVLYSMKTCVLKKLINLLADGLESRGLYTRELVSLNKTEYGLVGI